MTPLVPAGARQWLAPGVRYQDWPTHGAMMVRRREALTALYPVYGSWLRLALGVVAWGAGVAGAVVAGRDVTAEDGVSLASVGLLLLAAGLAVVVVATGSAVARAIASWWGLARVVRDDGGFVDVTGPSPQTAQLHERLRAEDRAAGAGGMWRPPLLARTAAATLAGLLAVAALVRAGLDLGAARLPYASAETRGEWLTVALVALVCLLTCLLTTSGLRRIHRARMHRTARPEDIDYLTTRPVAAPVSRPAPVHAPAPASPAGPAPSPATAQLPADTPLPAAAERPAAAEVPQADSPVAPSAAAPTAAPAAPAAPVAPAAADAAEVRPGPLVQLADGRHLEPGTTLLGRAPRPRAGEQVDAVVVLEDEQVSKNHLTVVLATDGVLVTDRGSTNGTTLHTADGTRPLTPGEATRLTDGDVLVLGRTSLTVGLPVDDVEATMLRPSR